MKKLRNLTFALCIGLSATTFSAQAAATDYPVCTRKASAEDVTAAKGMHAAGKRYYAKALYEQAIQSWVSAYNFDCNAHPLLINIGNAHEKLGDIGEAVKAFDQYVKRMGKSADPEVKEKANNLRRRITPTGPAPKPGPTPTPTPVPEPIVVPPADDTTTKQAGVPVGPIVVMSLGGAAAIAGVAVLAVGLGDISTAEETCPVRDECRDQTSIDLGNGGRTKATAGGIVMGAGLAALGGGLVWFFLSGGEDESEASSGSDITLTPVFSAGPRAASAGLNVRF